MDLQPRVVPPVGPHHLRATMGALSQKNIISLIRTCRWRAQGRDHLGTANEHLPPLRVEAAPSKDPADGRDFRPAPLVDLHRGLPHRGRGPRTVEDKREATIIYEGATPLHSLKVWPGMALPVAPLHQAPLPGLTRQTLP